MEVVCAQLGFTGKQPIFLSLKALNIIFMKEIFEEEEKSTRRHQKYQHEPAVEMG
jgi:hypothetical protein